MDVLYGAKVVSIATPGLGRLMIVNSPAYTHNV